MRKDREHFHKHTTLAPSCMHNLEADQERLRDIFSDKRLQLRYNYPKKLVQVWYDALSGLYCLYNIEGNYNLCRAIWELKRRQRTKKQLAEMYLAQLEGREKQTEDKIAELAQETADLARMRAVGKVTVSG
jgi:hypothetical protein